MSCQALQRSMAAVTLFLGVSAAAQVSVLTYHNDNMRTGLNSQEMVLTHANVNQFQFGKVFSHNVDGAIYGQPLYVPHMVIPGAGIHNVVYVATEHNSVYAFDADNTVGANGYPLWTVNLGASMIFQGAVAPETGITSTPVIDTANNAIYVVSFSQQGSDFSHQLHALDLGTGQEKSGSPVTIAASVPGVSPCGNGQMVPFVADAELQRAALLLANGNIYIGWGGSGLGCYNGWVMGYDATTLQQVGALNTTPNGAGGGAGGVWNGGAGPAADEEGGIYVASGNGIFDANVGMHDYGDSAIKLNSTLGIEQYFTPFDQAMLDTSDLDFGSGGPVLLPEQPGAHPNLLLVGSKDGDVYLIDRGTMGGYQPGGNSQIVQYLPALLLGEYGDAAYWNGFVYFLGTGRSTSDTLQAYSLTDGLLSTAPVFQSTSAFIYPGATPSISSNGQNDAIVWMQDNSSWLQSNSAVLFAYDATTLGTELYNSNQQAGRDAPGVAVKFTVPTVANGKVYVSGKNQLTVYGLLGATALPSAISFGTQQRNTTSSPQTVQLTNPQSTALTIKSVLVNGPFIQTNNCGKSLAATSSCTITLTFHPTYAGAFTGSLTINDSDPGTPQVVALSGSATDFVTVAPASLHFGTIAIGSSSSQQTITLKNNQSKVLSFTSIVPSGDYSQTNNCGKSLAAGGSCAINVTFTPTNRGSINGVVTITNNVSDGPQIVGLTGAGSGTVTSTVTVTPASLTFSPQAIGTTSASQSFTIKNTGTSSLSIFSITGTGNFTESSGCVGPLAARSTCVVTVTFTPSAIQSVTGAITITDSAGTSPQVVNLSGTGIAPVTLSPASLNFQEVAGGTSAASALTLTNKLPAALAITSIKASGGYTANSNCGTSVAAGQSCIIHVAFNPKAVGALNGTLAVINKSATTPVVALLSGTGLGPTTVSPTILSFAAQKVGTQSTPKTVTLTNNRAVPLAVGNIAVAGDFLETNSCGSSLGAGASCTIRVTFTPTALGTRGGTFIILDGSTSSPEVVKISGTGD